MVNPSGNLLKWFKRIFTLLAVGFLIFIGWQSRTILAVVIETAHPHLLLLSIVALIAAHFVAAASAVAGLKACDAVIPYSFALKTHINRLPARYLPGGFWHSVGRLLDFHTQGVKKPQLTTFFILENSLAISIAFLLGGSGLYYTRGLTDNWGIVALWAVIGNLFALILLPTFISRYTLKSFGKISLYFYCKAIAIYFIVWPLLALAFVSYFSAFPLAVGNLSSLAIGSTYLFSWAVGLATIFAPQGIGIFEVVAGHVLVAPLSLGSIAVLIAGFRVISLIADMTLWGLMQGIILSQWFLQNKDKCW